VDAVVLEVADRAVGSVVEAAQPLATLMPADAPIEAEVEIPAGQVGEVRVGDPARVKLEAFPFQKHGFLDGSVRVISEDAFPREGSGGQLVYRVRVALGDTGGLRHVRPNLRLLPGMTLAAEVKVGSRSVLSYFLYPIIRALDESLEEP
jgi:hemolysin D